MVVNFLLVKVIYKQNLDLRSRVCDFMFLWSNCKVIRDWVYVKGRVKNGGEFMQLI